jgi:non-canonical purine NTP pyrophosphatase (RdgB/HAM1 family)
MKHIYFVSENVSKYNEIENYLRKSNLNNSNNSIQLQMIKPEFEIQEIQSLDRQEIVLKKLNDAFIETKNNLDVQKETWIMVEDTSLCIDKMGGFPGAFIKYYLQSLPINSISHANCGSNATSYVTLGICKYLNDLDNDIVEDNILSPRVFDGFIEGVITEPRGTNGFGYDPIFRPNGSLITNAEMSMDEKENFNPRTIGFQKVINFLMT